MPVLKNQSLKKDKREGRIRKFYIPHPYMGGRPQGRPPVFYLKITFIILAGRGDDGSAPRNAVLELATEML